MEDIEKKIEGNKLIAEFMDGYKRYYSDTLGMVWDHEYYTPPLAGGKCDEDLKYHSSWDWLMPVVEKIESLKFDVRINGVTDHAGGLHQSCYIEDWKSDDVAKYHSSSKIESVYKAVVEFIKWHNKSK